MSRASRHAPAAKLSARLLAVVQEHGMRALDECPLPVGRRQVQRIVARESWQGGWRPRQAPDESKRCAVCGERFTRRFASGRSRSDALWKQKQTCSQSCARRHLWARGAYADRAQHGPRPKT